MRQIRSDNYPFHNNWRRNHNTSFFYRLFRLYRVVRNTDVLVGPQRFYPLTFHPIYFNLLLSSSIFHPPTFQWSNLPFFTFYPLPFILYLHSSTFHILPSILYLPSSTFYPLFTILQPSNYAIFHPPTYHSLTFNPLTFPPLSFHTLTFYPIYLSLFKLPSSNIPFFNLRFSNLSSSNLPSNKKRIFMDNL